MTKLAIIDLDGVVADNTARFAKAEEAKRALISLPDIMRKNGWSVDQWSASEIEKESRDEFWHTAFTPELVALDTLIEGAEQALEEVMGACDLIFFLTSRPLSMAQATIEWLNAHMTLGFSMADVIFKVPAFKYTKTTVWKAGMVQTLATKYGASEVLFVDDEAANANAVMNGAPDCEFSIRVCSSLALAVEKGE